MTAAPAPLHVLDPDMDKLKPFQFLWRVTDRELLAQSKPVVREAPPTADRTELENVTSIVDSGTASAVSLIAADPRNKPLPYRFSQIPRLPQVQPFEEDINSLGDLPAVSIIPRVAALRDADLDQEARSHLHDKPRQPMKAILSPFTLRAGPSSTDAEGASAFGMDFGGDLSADFPATDLITTRTTDNVDVAGDRSEPADRHLDAALKDMYGVICDLVPEVSRQGLTIRHQTDAILQPHVVHGTTLPDVELVKQRRLAFGRPFVSLKGSHAVQPRSHPHARVSWVIPLHGDVLIMHEATTPTSALFCADDSTPCESLEKTSTRLLWTPQQLLAFWSALCKLARLGRMGPVTLTLHGSSPDPFRRQPPQFNPTEPMVVIGTHIRLYCDLQWATRIRFALEALRLPDHAHGESIHVMAGHQKVDADVPAAPNNATTPQPPLPRTIKPFRRSTAKLCLVDARLRVLSVA